MQSAPFVTPSPSPEPPAPPSGPSRHTRLIAAVGLVIGLLVFGELWRRISQASDLRSLESRIGAQVTQLAEESNRLHTKIAGAQNDEEVARWAREEGKMVLPGEVLVVPLTPAADVEPTPTLQPAAANPPNWQIWREWLWGED